MSFMAFIVNPSQQVNWRPLKFRKQDFVEILQKFFTYLYFELYSPIYIRYLTKYLVFKWHLHFELCDKVESFDSSIAPLMSEIGIQ